MNTFPTFDLLRTFVGCLPVLPRCMSCNEVKGQTRDEFLVLFGLVWCSLALFGPKKLLLYFLWIRATRPLDGPVRSAIISFLSSAKARYKGVNHMGFSRLRTGFQGLPSRVRKAIASVTLFFFLYTVIGFLVLPPIVRAVAVKQLSKQLSRPVAIQKIKINPTPCPRRS